MPNYDFTRPIDLSTLPASVVLANAPDPARMIEGAPPIFGQDIVPHYYTSTGFVGSAARAYPIDDEATRNSVENAERMRTESAIMECLEARMRATALLKYHVVPENEKSPKEIKLAQLLTKLLERIPYFTRYRYCLMEALWLGKSAMVNTFGVEQVGDRYRTVIVDASPRHGDKLMFRYSDGTFKYKAGQLGIRVHAAFFANMPPKLQNLPYDQLRMKVESTQYGLVYWFDDYERDTMVVHKHIVEDGPWHEPRMMGRVMGVGIRDRIYWTWYAMNALLADLMTFVSRAALGVRIWRYPSGNPNWKTAVESAAKNAIANGVADILFPVEPNEYAGMYGVEQIEPGITGATMIRELIENFFLKKIKKYILGQLLTTEAESTGMGGGVAAAHIQTFSDIVRFDAANLSETLTRELLRKLQYENARDSMGTYPKLVLDCDEPDVAKRLSAISSAYQMDIPVKVEDVYMLTGLSIPEPGDDVVTVSTQQLRQQKAMLEMQGEEQMKQMRLQQQMQMEMAQQQAAMQQQMGGAPGQEQGQAPAQEAQPQDKAALNETPLDVSPQGTDRDNGPVMSGELAKNATGEATYEIQRQASSPWDGFWESFFRGARGVQPEVQTDPLPEVPDEQASAPAEVQSEPEPEVQPEPQPRPKVQNDPLVTTLSEIMDQYVQKQRTIQEWTQDLDRALRRQSLARGFDPTADRHHLVKQLGDALDHEMLVAQLTDMLDMRSSSYSADDEIDLRAKPDRYPEQDDYALNPPLTPKEAKKGKSLATPLYEAPEGLGKLSSDTSDYPSFIKPPKVTTEQPDASLTPQTPAMKPLTPPRKLKVHDETERAQVKDFNAGQIGKRMKQQGAPGNAGRLGYAPSEEGHFSFRGTDPHYNIAASMQDIWAEQSSNTVPSSALQDVIGEVFNNQSSSIDHSKHLSPQDKEAKARLLFEHADDIRHFVKAQYDHTQDVLKKKGIEYLVVYRGRKSSNPQPQYGVHEPVEMHPANSFSLSYDTAMKFAGPNGHVIAMKVPADRVFSTAMTGLGCLPEHEVVVLNHPENRAVVVPGQPGERKDFWNEAKQVHPRVVAMQAKQQAREQRRRDAATSRMASVASHFATQAKTNAQPGFPISLDDILGQQPDTANPAKHPEQAAEFANKLKARVSDPKRGYSPGSLPHQINIFRGTKANGIMPNGHAFTFALAQKMPDYLPLVMHHPESGTTAYELTHKKSIAHILKHPNQAKFYSLIRPPRPGTTTFTTIPLDRLRLRQKETV